MSAYHRFLKLIIQQLACTSILGGIFHPLGWRLKSRLAALAVHLRGRLLDNHTGGVLNTVEGWSPGAKRLKAAHFNLAANSPQ